MGLLLSPVAFSFADTAATTDNAESAGVASADNPPSENPSTATSASLPVTSSASMALSWLNKMHQAFSILNFKMSYVVLKPRAQSEPYLWRHAVVDGVEMEHLSLLNGPGREALRIGTKVSYFEPNVPAYSLRSDVINGPIPAQFFQTMDSLLVGYDAVLVGRSRVSGRAAQQLRIVSRDKSRYGFNLWLDQETGLLLKLDMLDLTGQLVEQIQVTSLVVSPEPDEYFGRIDAARLPDVITPVAIPVRPHDWQATWMPIGMQEAKRDVHRLPGTGEIVNYLLLSDGLVDVSIYIQKGHALNGEPGWLRHEANTLLTLHNGDVDVTVIGKIPAGTANLIAQSMVLNVPGGKP